MITFYGELICLITNDGAFVVYTSTFKSALFIQSTQTQFLWKMYALFNILKVSRVFR